MSWPTSGDIDGLPGAMASRWDVPAGRVVLEGGIVHVWYAALDRAFEDVERFTECLSADERARAARRRFGDDRRRFAVARATLRHILGWYLGVRPDRLRFAYEVNGKPVLDGGLRDSGLRFSLSHTGPRAVYAVALGAPIGVDLECVRSLDDLERTARHVFSARERLELLDLPAATRLLGFYNCWTRKEAYLKALGCGLGGPANRFSVTLRPDEPAAIVAIDGDPDGPSRWTVHALAPESGYVGALAVYGQGWRVEQWRWPGA